MDELARLKELLTRNAGEGLTPTALPGVSIQCSRTTTVRTGAITEPTLAVIAQGAKETALNGRTYAYGPGQVVITSLELPVIGRIVRASAEEPFLALTTPGGRWVAVRRRHDLTVTIATRDLDPATITIEPICDPATRLLGPDPEDP